MSVLLETSLGDLVIDLEVERCPKACENFLKLCKTYAYSFNAFFSVQRDFLAQTGDPHSRGDGGSSIWHRLPSSSPAYSSTPYFLPERPRSLRHSQRGTVSLALTSPTGDEDEDAPRLAGSQFFITLGSEIDYLDGKHAVIGTVVEGQEQGGTLDKINAAFVDEKMRPLQDIRIRHAEVLDDPFPDPEGLFLPSRTPSPTPSQLANARLDASEALEDPSLRPVEEVEAEKRLADTNAAALTLEMVGDLPHADVRPPENILFVCKLNPVTRSEDLELIFSRFGSILSCEVIKDKKTGDSLQYAFIEFDKKEQAEQAYFKMQNVLVDDRRIWVDFSQSVGKLHASWLSGRKGGVSSSSASAANVNYGAGPPGRGSVAPGSRGGGRAGTEMVFDFPTPRHGDSHGASGNYREDRRGSYDDRGRGGGGSRHSDRDRDRYDDRDRHYSSGRYERERDDHRSTHKSGREYDDCRERHSGSRYRDEPRDRDRNDRARRGEERRERSPKREERYRR